MFNYKIYNNNNFIFTYLDYDDKHTLKKQLNMSLDTVKNKLFSIEVHNQKRKYEKEEEHESIGSIQITTIRHE